MTELPIFVLSQARSGSTMIQRVLNQTPGILIQGEVFGMFTAMVDGYKSLFNSERAHQCFVSEGTDDDVIQKAEARLRDPADFSAVVNSLNKSRIHRIYRELAHELFNPTKRDIRWGFKEIRCCTRDWFLIKFLSELFPGSKFVLTVRNPVSQIRSMFTANWWPEVDLNRAIELWNGQMESFKQAAAQRPDDCRLIRYEDVVTTKEILTQTLSWLGIELQPCHEKVVFGMEKVGATTPKAQFPEDAVHRIIRECWERHLDVYPM